MFGPRKIFVGFLSLILLVCLMSTAFTSSFKSTVGNPTKIEKIVNQSNLYDSLINRITGQAQGAIGDASSTTQNIIKPLAMEAFTQADFQKDMNQIISGNYAWLEGHSAKPIFSVDVDSVKVNFADQIANYVKQRLSELPTCTTTQALQLVNANPLSLSCLPKSLSPAQAATNVSDEIQDSNLLLSNPVLNANNLDAINHESGAYYTKISKAPKVYKWATKVPVYLVIIDLVLAAAIILFLGRKKGLRRVGLTLIISGLLLVIIRLCSNRIVSRIDSHINKTNSLGSLKSAFVNIASAVEQSLVKTDLKFGLIYIALGLILVAGFFLIKKSAEGLKIPRRNKDNSSQDNSDFTESVEEYQAQPIRLSNNRHHGPSMDIMNDPSKGYNPGSRKHRPDAQTAPPLKNTSTQSQPGSRRKPPRLIQ